VIDWELCDELSFPIYDILDLCLWVVFGRGQGEVDPFNALERLLNGDDPLARELRSTLGRYARRMGFPKEALPPMVTLAVGRILPEEVSLPGTGRDGELRQGPRGGEEDPGNARRRAGGGKGLDVSVARVVRNIGSGYAGAGVNGLVLLLLTPLVIRHLGPGDYGIWVLASAIGSYLGFLNAGSGAVGVRAVASLAGTGRAARPAGRSAPSSGST